ncbi:hypothetical protein CX750_14740 [Salmonella enterica]|uniref:Uncharacterized protein n=4 Tax=Salmonella enterica subsp. salamae TaxID=59202 RepID=A0A5Y1WM71_SALER|nr:hypothetical protein DOE57_09970 [Salmonella enterica subsp. salamae serovar 56:b:[1,5]]EAR2000040.1 hypothetical protein [Salmonella enterica]ECC1609069.1 hypothetical protein [Salmonella enterica subsp. salamae]EEJ4596005.1 hypothetical protein [Salmonella enterica subsp. salamae serovar 47:b:e,n,x,z15]HAC6507557.1 hypothetical protein [Salmonella enterica subsp. salamae serovar 30:1,z28:z6]HAE4726126.1 hypothetical protein [Salmonella enterica subsp. salamae serovar 47:a:1,5]HAE6916693.
MAVIFPTYLRVKSIRFNGKTGSGLRHNYSLKNNLNIIVCFIFYNYQLHQYIHVFYLNGIIYCIIHKNKYPPL